jgi:hypothetical protein
MIEATEDFSSVDLYKTEIMLQEEEAGKKEEEEEKKIKHKF